MTSFHTHLTILENYTVTRRIPLIIKSLSTRHEIILKLSHLFTRILHSRPDIDAKYLAVLFPVDSDLNHTADRGTLEEYSEKLGNMDLEKSLRVTEKWNWSWGECLVDWVEICKAYQEEAI